jgi:hypothetical protein
MWGLSVLSFTKIGQDLRKVVRNFLYAFQTSLTCHGADLIDKYDCCHGADFIDKYDSCHGADLIDKYDCFHGADLIDKYDCCH